MTHEEKVKWLDQLEDSLTRSETARKDVDLLVLYEYRKAKEELKEEQHEHHPGV